MTYQEAYDWGKKQLEEQQISDAALDARLLLEYVCHTNRNDLLVHGNRPLDDIASACYKAYVEKRAKHIPLQHMLHNQEFMGLSFYVNEHVLIPRQDTEILVEEVMRGLFDGMRILDLCTGSGCILLSLLHYSNDCQGTGTDLSDEALAVAKENAERFRLDNRARFIKSDLFEKVEGIFDIVVSNPPYICRDVIASLMPEVRDHEPVMALDGGPDGLFFYREIISQADRYLTHGGSLYFEIGYDQGEAVSRLMEENGYREVRVVKDYAGLDRVVYGINGNMP